jgi:aromatic-L-amino-acid/L-tryptophan decarboxylase
LSPVVDCQRPPQNAEPATATATAMDANASLDPQDWKAFRTQAHRMLDDMLGYVENIRERPVWQPLPDQVRSKLRSGHLPRRPNDLPTVHSEFMRDILPYAAGNVHPGFMGWVHGGGAPVGMLAEMLAAGLNANVAGRDHAPVEVERQISQWMRELFGFPETSHGLFVTGTSIANLIAVVIARDAALDFSVRRTGVSAKTKHLTAYASTAVHGCIAKAMDISGLGSDALRLVPTDQRHHIDLAQLAKAIEMDRQAGRTPFLVVGNAGTVDTGAIDDLAALASVCERQRLWFHVDGAVGALAQFAPDLAPKLAGIERADSLAFDFHKLGQVPYDAGYILVRDGALQQSAFACPAAYLQRLPRGLSAGSPWPCDFGPDLSRSFRALKAWFTLKVYGADALGAVISHTCALARHLETRIKATPELELLAPVELNIVCFRYRAGDPNHLNELNEKIVMALQESGIAAPSTTTLDGRLAIRAAIVNHRTTRADIDALVDRTLSLGRTLTNTAPQSQPAKPQDLHAHDFLISGLQTVQQRLATQPATPALLFLRANILSQLGRKPEAVDAYHAVLQLDSAHAGALNNLARLLYAKGEKYEAQTIYEEAVTKHPDDVMTRVNLATVLLQDHQTEKAREHYAHALKLDPNFRQAHIGMSFVQSALGNEDLAAWHRRTAFYSQCVIPLTYRGQEPPIPVLALASVAGGNVRIETFLSDRVFLTYLVATEFYHSSVPLPPHQLIVNAIGDADLTSPALIGAQALLANTTAPVINPPAAVLATGRCEIARRLSDVPGVITARTVTLSRTQLAAPDARTSLARHGFAFPLLLRTPGFHGGENFLRLATSDDLPAALATLPGSDLTVIEYLDARGPDGKARKYRVMMIDGRLYPLHAAISNNWKIHYYTADMADHPEHRAEEAEFLTNMPAVLGPCAMCALETIQKTLGLDYGGIDFGLNQQRQILLFEANATMAIVSPNADHRWDYRRPAINKIFEATAKMLMNRALPQVERHSNANAQEARA